MQSLYGCHPSHCADFRGQEPTKDFRARAVFVQWRQQWETASWCGDDCDEDGGEQLS